jgi:uncharacterized ion transporter superfamily protein YfcC
MSEIIPAGSFERMDRSYSDVIDEVQIMVEAGHREDLATAPQFLPFGGMSRFFARLAAPARAL